MLALLWILLKICNYFLAWKFPIKNPHKQIQKYSRIDQKKNSPKKQTFVWLHWITCDIFPHLFIILSIHFCGGFSCSTQLKTYISYPFEFKVMFALVENSKWIIYIYFMWGFFIGYLYFTLWISISQLSLQ